MAEATPINDARNLAASGWFGYGRWDAPYWFVGLEPGGDDDPIWYETWIRLGGHELCDCREHHIGSKYPKWHSADKPPTQSTWRPLIQLLLGCLGTRDELLFGSTGRSDQLDTVRAYQRDRWGTLDGDTALTEVSAIRARSHATQVDRSAFREHRIAVLHDRLKGHSPKFAVFYGKAYAPIYERIIGARFDANDYVWRGSTLCVLVRHPAARHHFVGIRSCEWWVAKGREIALKIKLKEGGDQDSQPHMQDLSLNSTLPQSHVGVSSYRTPPDLSQKITPLQSDVVRLLCRDNPKKVGSKSHLRFDCYTDGMTVGEYEIGVRRRLGKAEAAKCRDDLQSDYARGYILIERDGKGLSIWVSPTFRV